MQKIKTIFLIIVLSGISLLGFQQTNKSIDSLFALMDKVSLNTQNDYEMIKDLQSDTTFIIKLENYLYQCYAFWPMEFERELLERIESWEKSQEKQSIKPNILLDSLKNQLIIRYGKKYVLYLETPYFLKIRALDIQRSEYVVSRPGREIKVPKINLVVEVIDVLKGNHAYSNGDIITVSYLPHTFKESPQPNFEINSIYAFPLKHWFRPSMANYDELMMKLNGLDTFYKIENGNVTMPLLYSENNQKSWIDFKKILEKEYFFRENEFKGVNK
ncbi:MAG: hypothetical protein QY331_13045 [Melioribacteraceae bacterium]|nr:MAG: hypothetical protein QY331_13045 [Melioribacteraceae bacterium]